MIWLGYAFENLCLQHIDKLKERMGIASVYTEQSAYRKVGTKYEKGFQIDLIIDRKDDAINLCEMKFYNASYKIDKKYALELQNRRQRFIEEVRTKKQVFNTFITNYPLLENEHSRDVVDSAYLLDDLF